MQQRGNVTEGKAYQLWNMGNGMLVIVPENEAQEIIAFIEKENYQTRVSGNITNDSEIILTSKGVNAGVHHYRY